MRPYQEYFIVRILGILLAIFYIMVDIFVGFPRHLLTWGLWSFAILMCQVR